MNPEGAPAKAMTLLRFAKCKDSNVDGQVGNKTPALFMKLVSNKKKTKQKKSKIQAINGWQQKGNKKRIQEKAKNAKQSTKQKVTGDKNLEH